MRLSIKKNPKYQGTDDSYSYKVMLDDYEIGKGVTDVNLSMNPASNPVLNLTVVPDDLDIDANVVCDLKKFWADD